jgi:C1A family cysteine protease
MSSESEIPQTDKSTAVEADLAKEVEGLRDRLKQYKALEEDLAAQRVFEAAKKRLWGWLTVGGVGTLALTFVGYKQLDEYIQALVKGKIEAVSEQHLSDQIERQVSAVVTSKDGYINARINETVGRFVASQRLSGSASSLLSSSAGTLTTTSTQSSLDYKDDLGPVRDQGSEGGVVGFAVAAAIEYQIFKTTKAHVPISPRYIYYVARKATGNSQSDNGAQITDAIKMLSMDGAVAEDIWPYHPGEFAASPPPSLDKAKRYRIAKAQSVKTVDEVKAALQQIGPVVTGLAVYSAFETDTVAKSGKVPDVTSKDTLLGGHAICIVGYDDKKKLFKFRNSWGEHWGEGGYGYISYNYFSSNAVDTWAISL